MIPVSPLPSPLSWLIIAAIGPPSLSSSLPPLQGGGGIFFSRLIIYKCFLNHPLRGNCSYWIATAWRCPKGEVWESLAGVLRALCLSPLPLRGRHRCRAHRLISGKRTLTSGRCKSQKFQRRLFLFPPCRNSTRWEINCHQGIMVRVRPARSIRVGEKSQFDWDDYLEQLSAL